MAQTTAQVARQRRALRAVEQPDPMLTVAQVMALIGFGETKTRDLIRGGAFTFIRDGRNIRVSLASVLEWRRARTVDAA